MVQQELSFFWSLTEQIPLDLIYDDAKPNFAAMYAVPNTYVMYAGGTTGTVISGNLTIDIDQMTYKTSKKPNIVQSMLYKVMGIKLEKK